jgi:hypothetical protein
MPLLDKFPRELDLFDISATQGSKNCIVALLREHSSKELQRYCDDRREK